MAFKITLGTLGTILTLDAEPFKKGVDGARSSLAGLNTAITAAATGAGATLAAGIGISVKAFADLEQSVMNAAAVTREGVANFAAFEQAARAASAGSVFSAKEAAQGLQFLSMAGLDAAQSIKALPGVLKLATAGGVELAFAADLASDAMTAFKLGAEDLGRVNDVLIATTTRANTNLEKLGLSLQYVAPIAGATGQSIESISAILGVMANAGVKNEKAGTALRAALLRLQAPTKQGAKMLKQLGINARDSSGNMRDIVDIFGDLADASTKFNQTDLNAALSKVFGANAISGVVGALNQGSDALKKFRDELVASQGEAARIADLMQNTVSSQFRMLQGNVENLASTFGQFFAPALREVNKTLTTTIQETLSSEKKFKEMRDTVVALINTGASAVETFGKLAQAVLIVSGAAMESAHGISLLIKAIQTFKAGLDVEKTLGFTAEGKRARAEYKRLFGELESQAKRSGTIFKNMVDLGAGIAETSDKAAAALRRGAVAAGEMNKEKLKELAITNKIVKAQEGTRRRISDTTSTAKKKAAGRVAPVAEMAPRDRAKEEAQESRRRMAAEVEAVQRLLDYKEKVRKQNEEQTKKFEREILQDRIANAKKIASIMSQSVTQAFDVLGLVFDGSAFQNFASAFEGIANDINKRFESIAKKMKEDPTAKFDEVLRGEVWQMLGSALQALSIAALKTVLEHEKAQQHFKVIGSKVRELGFGDGLTNVLEAMEPAIGVFLTVADVLKPLVDSMGGIDWGNISASMFNATKSFVSTILGVGKVIAWAGQKTAEAQLWFLSQFPDRMFRGTKDKIRKSLDRINDTIDALNAAQEAIDDLSLADSQKAYNEQLEKATDGMKELNDQLTNIPSGFRKFNLRRFEATQVAGGGMDNGGLRTREQAVGNTYIMAANTVAASPMELKAMLERSGFETNGQYGVISAQASPSDRRARLLG